MSGVHDRPLVSVVMIFFNEKNFISEAIASVVAQTYAHWELLLVDDGSTDESTKIAKQAAGRDSNRIRYVEHPGHENRGMAAARALGIEAARGSLLSFLDADDLWPPETLAERVALLRDFPSATVAYGNTVYWHSWNEGAKRSDSIPTFGVPSRIVLEPPQLIPPMIRGEIAVPCTCSLLIETEALRHMPPIPRSFRSLYEDQVLLASLFLRENVVADDSRWAFYRQHAGSATRTTLDGRRSRSQFLDWLEHHSAAEGLFEDEIRNAVREARWRMRHPTIATLLRRLAKLRARV